MVVVFLVFWENSIMFFSVAAPIYIPTNCVWGLPFLYILANVHYLCSFLWSILIGVRWYLIAVFNLNFFDDIEHLFKCLLSIFMPSLEKNLYLGLLPSFYSGCLLVQCWVMWAVYIFCILNVISLIICKYFLPFMKTDLSKEEMQMPNRHMKGSPTL